jgi:septal ring factor EnvC (AmiA/AmiB activator)
MLIRISLIIAILAGLAVGALNFVKIKETITTLRTDLADEKKARATAETDRDKAKRELAKTSADLKQTQDTLKTTIAEKDKAVANEAVQAKRAGQLADELTKMRKDLGDVQAELAAYKETGDTPEQIMAFNKQIKQLQDGLDVANAEKKILAHKIAKQEAELARYNGPENQRPVYLPAQLSGRILVIDPKWDFVVLNVVEDQGIVPDGELLVSRDGRLVAKVKVASVQQNSCIANVMPGWKLGEVLEGDRVIPAYPAS